VAALAKAAKRAAAPKDALTNDNILSCYDRNHDSRVLLLVPECAENVIDLCPFLAEE